MATRMLLSSLSRRSAAAAAHSCRLRTAFVRPVLFRTFATEQVPVPNMGDSITEGTVVEWSVDVGSAVSADDIVVVIETDKVSVEVRSPIGGVLTEQLAEVDSVVEVGQPLFKLDTEAVAAEKPPPKADPAPESPPQEEKKAAPEATPEAPPAPKKPDPAPQQQKKAAPAPAPPSPDGAPARGETRVKMSRMRLRIAERLKEAQNTAAMLTTFQECDMGNLMALRSRLKEEFEKKHGIKLGFMSAFVKASTAALKEIPAVNAVIDESTKEVVYREYCDVSVAVASPNGLVVPVIRNAESMSFAQVEKTIAGYGKKAKEGTLSLEEMSGGTFSISNGGVFGSLMGTPIINYSPQAAILGMHATKLRPVVVEGGKIEARPMMYLALTYDHRIIDGREAVTFLKSVAQKIENPERLLLDL